MNLNSIKTSFQTYLALIFAKYPFAVEIARQVVRIFDNDCNCNIYKNGELSLLKHIIAIRKGYFFDIGANKGDWSAAALSADFKGKIIAIDPLISNVAILEKRFKSVPQFSTKQYALSDSIGEVDFYSNIDTTQSETDSLYNMNNIGYAPKLNIVKVKCITLDSLSEELAINKIDFLKIDVEGHELSVLKGANKFLSEGLIDFIQIEFGHAARAARIYLYDIVKLANEYSYNIFVIMPKGLMPLNYTPFSENKYSLINLLLVQKSIVHEINDYVLK